MNDTKSAAEPTELAPITHDIANPIRLDAAMVAEAFAQIDALAAITGITEDNRGKVDHLVRSITTSGNRLEDDRKRLKAAPLELGRRIDAACASLAVRLDSAKRRGQRMQDDDQQRLAAARRAIEAEQQRKVDEAARIAEERRQADAAALAQLRATGEQLTPQDIEVVRELEAEAAVERELEAIVPLPAVPAPVKTGTTRRMVKVLVIEDASKIPLEVNGVPLWKLDEAAVKRVLLGGTPIPGGAHIEEQAQLATRGY